MNAAGPSVAAVVVTYNRKDAVTGCVARLLGQSRPPERVFVIDNASTDGTPERLAEAGWRDHPAVEYVRLDRNTGGAGGFHDGMRRAHAAGFDWIWIMDDDAQPSRDALALMAAHFDDPGVACVLPMMTLADGSPDLASTHRGILKPRDAIDDDHLGRPLTAAEIAGRDTVDISYFSFVGPCFARATIDRVGLPLAQFFIHYDDIEYSQRVVGIGRAVVVLAASIRHSEAQMDDNVRLVRGKRRSGQEYSRLWLRYYGYRNLTWLIMHRKLDAPRWPLFVRHARKLAQVLRHDDHKWRRLRFWNAAFVDGLRGRFDNDKPRAILR